MTDKTLPTLVESSAFAGNTLVLTRPNGGTDDQKTPGSQILDYIAANFSITADDVDDTSTTNKFVDSALITKVGGIEAGADVTDTANVTAAGALMDSEVTSLSGIKSLVVPDSTTISSFGKTLVDDADASTARTTLGLVIGTNVQAYSSVLAATTASFTTADETKLDGIEALADVTDATNVAAAGAIMDGDFSTNGLMKRTGAGAYATATANTDYQGVLSEGAFANGDKTKLDGVEALADVTDATNVAAAGAFMKSADDMDDITDGVTYVKYSQTEKTKLSGIASGAEVNQNAFTTVSVSGQSDVVADGKTDTLTLVAGSNITITTDASTDSITIASTGGGSTDSFKTISVAGQSDVVADSSTDTLTLAAGANITITTNDTTDTITIAASGGGGSGSTVDMGNAIVDVGLYLDESLNAGVGASQTIGLGANTITLIPFVAPISHTSDLHGADVTGGSGNFKILIYETDATTNAPGACVFEEIVTVSGTGFKSVTADFDYIAGTQYWRGIWASASITIRGNVGTVLRTVGTPTSTEVINSAALRRTVTYDSGAGTAPDPWTFSSSEFLAVNTTIPRVRSRVGALL